MQHGYGIEKWADGSSYEGYVYVNLDNTLRKLNKDMENLLGQTKQYTQANSKTTQFKARASITGLMEKHMKAIGSTIKCQETANSLILTERFTKDSLRMIRNLGMGL